MATAAVVLLGMWPLPREAAAQVRGLYPSGMSATNAGVTAEPGLTYSNLFIFNARDESRGPDGEVVATGANAVLLDLITSAWVSQRTMLGGAKLSATATFIVSNNSLASDTLGQLSAGGGFGDFFVQPFILGWQTDQVGIRAAYGFLAPTGRFNAGASDNVGSGYWTNVVSLGTTIGLRRDNSTALSAFHMYEFHTVQEGTGVHPGQTANLDYSLTQTIQLRQDLRLQLGLVGYGQWQTTDKTGPAVSPGEAGARYAVNAVGFAGNLVLPERKTSLGLKYFKEFSSRSTYQGYSLHIAAAIAF